MDKTHSIDLTVPQVRHYMDKRVLERGKKFTYILHLAFIKLLLLESFLTLYICL